MEALVLRPGVQADPRVSRASDQGGGLRSVGKQTLLLGNLRTMVGPTSQVRCRAEGDGRRVTDADPHATTALADYIVARTCDASAGEAGAVVATPAAADVDPKLAFLASLWKAKRMLRSQIAPRLMLLPVWFSSA